MKLKTKEPLVTLDHYSTRPSGDGFEILADDEVVAWSMEGRWALYLLALLVEADPNGQSTTTQKKGKHL